MSQTDTRPLPEQPSQQPTGEGSPPNPWAAPPSPPQELSDVSVPPAGRRRAPGWAALVSAAALAAALASGATLAGARMLDEGTSPVSSTSTSSRQSPPPSTAGTPASWADVAATVAPSVVTIQVSSGSGSGQGSGVVLDQQGNILTNNHVVTGAGGGARLDVVLSDGRVFTDVTVVGTDPTTDLAVLAITDPPADLVPATLGSSADVVVGQEVMAVGNPLGLSDTVTTGIVSAVDRPVTTQADRGQTLPDPSGRSRARSEPVVTNAIQTDAAINPGNSGGALVDATGSVIGINSSIASTSADSGSIGIGFAIPIDEARRIATQLLTDGSAQHALLGVNLKDATATTDGVTRRGAGIAEVVAGSAADQAGLLTGDMVVSIDGDAVAGAESLTAQVRERAPGTAVTLQVVRAGTAREVSVTLGTREG